jgi:hypothetical protein
LINGDDFSFAHIFGVPADSILQPPIGGCKRKEVNGYWNGY